MTPAEALDRVHAAGRKGGFILTAHARDRMRGRGAGVQDVRRALATATVCTPTDGGRWRAPGRDLDGDELVCVVAIEGLVIVVTVF